MNRLSMFAYGFIVFCFASCSPKHNKNSETNHSDLKGLQIKKHILPEADILNLKSYYLSDYYQDTTEWLYGYNFKLHALDRFNLRNGKATQLSFYTEGHSAVISPITGLMVCSPDSIWVVDATQSALLLDGDGELLRKVKLSSNLPSGQSVMVERNYAISTTDLYYDKVRHSLLFGIRNASTHPVSFGVREVFLSDSIPPVTYALQPSVEIPDIGDGDYANMNRPNITFTSDKILYNYPVESHVYVMDRKSGKTEIHEAYSRFCKNKADKCESKEDYTKWEKHGVVNPHFYEVGYLPARDMYIRLHVGEEEYNTSKKLNDILAGRKLYLTVFDNQFNILGESELATKRYSLLTGWCMTSDALLLYVDNPLSSENKEEIFEYDELRW